jgi:hypothetical protein
LIKLGGGGGGIGGLWSGLTEGTRGGFLCGGSVAWDWGEGVTVDGNS